MQQPCLTTSNNLHPCTYLDTYEDCKGSVCAKPHKGRWKTYWENRLHGDTFYSFFTNRMLVDGKKRKSNGREVRKMKDFKNEQHLIVAIIWA